MKAPRYSLDQLTPAQQAEAMSIMHPNGPQPCKNANPSPNADPAAILTPPKARLRQKEGDGMNKTERAFFGYLKSSQPGATIYVQDVTLRIGNGVRYTPDFMIDGPSATFFEVKGFMRDDAAVKIKVAARVYRCFSFILASKRKGGGWNLQRILP